MKIGYFISQSIKSLWRNGVMSFASIMVLMSCLVVIGGFSLIVINVDYNLEQLGLLNEIAVFTERKLAGNEEALADIERQIRALDNVASVIHVTPEEGLADLGPEWFGDNMELLEEYKGEKNPLSDSFKITYKDNTGVANLTYQLRQIEGVKKVADRLDLAMKLESLKKGIMLIFVWFLVILLVVSLFVIINTIKLAVYSRRHEITVMRYVGATSWFITLPFVFEGIIIGIIASGIAYLVEWYVYLAIEKMVVTELAMISIYRFSNINIALLMGFFAVGICTSIIGSCISLGKYLKS